MNNSKYSNQNEEPNRTITSKAECSPKHRQSKLTHPHSPSILSILKRKMPIHDFIQAYDFSKLTPEVKQKATTLLKQLECLAFPEKPPSGFHIFMQQMRSKVESLMGVEFKKLKETCLAKWKTLTAEEKKVLYDESYTLYSEYQEQRIKYFKKQTQIKLQLLELNGTIVPKKLKTSTGFRVYRREYSKKMKELLPSKTAKERHAEVKKEWKLLPKKEKQTYIAKSEEEKKAKIHQWIIEKLKVK